MDTFPDTFYEQAINCRCRVNLDTESVSNVEAFAIAEELEVDRCARRIIQTGDTGYSLGIYSVTKDKVRFADTDRKILHPTDDAASADRAGIAYTVSAVFTDREDIPLNTQSRKSIMDSLETFMGLMNKLAAGDRRCRPGHCGALQPWCHPLPG